jgi:phage gpG-like protein
MSVDTTQFRERMARIESRVISEMNAFAEEALYLFHAYVEENFNQGRRPGPKSHSDKLYVDTGALTQSFIPGRPGSLAKVERTAEGNRSRLGTTIRYAAIHEFGGEIPSRNIEMDARPYFRPAIAKLNSEGRALFERRINEIFRRAFASA